MHRRFACLLALLAVLPAAPALGQGVAPPGNAGVEEYQESIPTAQGSRPPSSGDSGDGSDGSSAGTSGTGQPGPTATPGTPGPSVALAPEVQRELRAAGKDGAATADLARETAPAAVPRSNAPAVAAPSDDGDSPIGAVLNGLSGSGSGMGLALPVVLLAMGAGGLALAVRGRRPRS